MQVAFNDIQCKSIFMAATNFFEKIFFNIRNRKYIYFKANNALS